jgi:hypothetical protein
MKAIQVEVDSSSSSKLIGSRVNGLSNRRRREKEERDSKREILEFLNNLKRRKWRSQTSE